MPKRRPASQPTRLQRIAALTLAIVAAPLLCISCFGQANSAQASQADAGVVNVNEVTLNLMVRDKKGKPVLDLKPEDIAVTDGGTPVKIANIRFVASEHGGEHFLTLVFDRLDLAASHNARDIAAKILKFI